MADRKAAVVGALIVFVILTVGSGGFMFAMMLENEELSKLDVTYAKQIDALAKESDALKQEAEGVKKDETALNARTDDLTTLVRENIDRTNQRFTRFDEARRRVAPAWEEVTTTTKSENQEIERLFQQMKQAEDSFVEAKKRLDDELATARKSLESKKKQVKDLEEGFIKEIAQKTDRLKELQEKIERIKKMRERELEVQADGKIITVGDPVTKFVSIDIGRVHGVREGMKFSVFEEKKSGEKIIKGRIEVVTVRPHSSDCVILPAEEELPHCPQCGWVASKLDMRNCVYCYYGDNNDEVQQLEKPRTGLRVSANRLNPVVAGDYVSNPYFTPGEVLTFVLGGDTIYLSKREIKRFVEDHGGRLDDSLTVDTHYLVAGTGPEADALLKRARDIGVKIMKEEELYKFFGEPR